MPITEQRKSKSEETLEESFTAALEVAKDRQKDYGDDWLEYPEAELLTLAKKSMLKANVGSEPSRRRDGALDAINYLAIYAKKLQGR